MTTQATIETTVGPSLPRPQGLSPGRQVTDWGGMRAADVAHVAEPATEDELRAIVAWAAAAGLGVSVRGTGHSAGGQSFRAGGLLVDLRRLDGILALDPAGRRVRVQAGATWGALTRRLEPHRLAVTTKQEFDTFTVGGSVAANVHGKTIDYGPLIESIVELRLLTASGDILTVSRESHGELFRLVVGGYGLFGIVVDVTLALVEDRPVQKSEVVRMHAAPLVASYLERVRRPDRPPLCYGFLNADGTEGFYVTYTYADHLGGQPLEALARHETRPALFNAFAALARRSRWVRRRAFGVMWAESAAPEATLRSRRLLLWDAAPRAFDDMLLQKFYVPCEAFAPFAGRVGAILAKHDLAVLTNHFRFVPGNGEAFLSFDADDTVCLIPAYLAEKRSRRWMARFERATTELLDACLEAGGRYYLTFDSLATRAELQRAYPQIEAFFRLKRHYDPQQVFSSEFYERYRT